MSQERLFIVTYDIGNKRRWRHVFRLMKGYGRWLQLSVFQCRLNPRRRVEMAAALERLIKREEDHVLIMDLGDANSVELDIESFGKRFEPVRRSAIVI